MSGTAPRQTGRRRRPGHQATSPLKRGAMHAQPAIGPHDRSIDGTRQALWRRVTKFDSMACALADRHYSRRKPGSGQFMPPGQTLVLLADRAVFGWWRPHPASGLRSMNGLDGWTCTIFRNESPVLSSSLIVAAELALYDEGHDIGPDGLLTYVWDSRVRSTNPGACFKAAGWRRIGRSADGRKTLLQKRPAATP